MAIPSSKLSTHGTGQPQATGTDQLTKDASTTGKKTHGGANTSFAPGALSEEVLSRRSSTSSSMAGKHAKLKGSPRPSIDGSPLASPSVEDIKAIKAIEDVKPVEETQLTDSKAVEGKVASGASTPEEIQKLVEPTLKEIAAIIAVEEFFTEEEMQLGQQAHLERCHDYGASDADWNQFLNDSAGTVKYGESASADATLAGLNDTQGVLRVSAGWMDVKGRMVTSNESFEVIREHVPAAGPDRPATHRWFVKGEEGQVVKFSDLQRYLNVKPGKPAPEEEAPADTQAKKPTEQEQAQKLKLQSERLQQEAIGRRDAELLRIHQEYKHPADGGKSKARGTPLRTLMRKLSEESKLAARRDEFESPDSKLMQVPPNKTPTPATESWSNLESSFSVGAGPRMGNMRLMIVHEKNDTEGRIIIQANDGRELSRRDAVAAKAAKGKDGDAIELHAVDELHGDILAQFQGVRYVEPMGPAHFAGVKSGNLRRMGEMLASYYKERDLEADLQEPLHLRLTMQDNSVHDLKFGPNGVTSELVLPKPSWGKNAGLALGVGDQPAADISLYSYRGADGGVKTTPDGTVDSKVVMSTGQALKTGPLIKDRASIVGNLVRAGEGLGNLVTGNMFDPRTPLAFIANLVPFVAFRFGAIFFEILMISENIKASTGHKDAAGKAVFFEGSAAVSAAGKASITAGQIAMVACLIVAFNEVISLMKREAKRMIPEHWHKPESTIGQVALDVAGGSAEEALRLSVGGGVQNIPAWDFGRFTKADLPMLGSVGAQGVAKALKRRIGAPENHPLKHAAVNTAVISLYELVSRSLSIQHGAKFIEAMATRATTRLIDKLLIEWIGHIGNSTGAFGPNASAYADQMDRESRFRNGVAYIKNMMNQLVLHGGSMTDLRKIRRFEQRVEQFGHMLGPWMMSKFDRMEADLTKEVDDQKQYLRDLNQAMKQDAKTGGEGGAVQAQAQVAFDRYQSRVDASRKQLGLPSMYGTDASARPASYDTRALHPKTVDFDRRNLQAFAEQQKKDLLPHEIVRNPVVQGADGKQRPAIGVKEATMRRPDDVRRDDTTFTTRAQSRAMRITMAMKEFKPIHSQLKDARIEVPGKEGKQPLPSWLIDEIMLALTVYTEQSQPVHYKNRYPILEGTPRWRELADGLFVERMITSQAGNRTGDKRQWVDARTQLLMNLAANILTKSPAEFYRTVNTLAYYEKLPEGKDLADGKKGKDPITSRSIEPGTYVHMSETLSVSLDPAGMPPGFGLQVAKYGADAPERSLMIVGFGNTMINITDAAVLSQAEQIAVPGMVMRFDHMHPMDPNDLSDKDQKAGHRKLGQVVYFVQANTYEWEQAFYGAKDWLDGKEDAKKPAAGSLMLDPSTNALYQYDEKANGLRKVDAVPADDNAHERLDARLRSYFHGKPCWSDVWMEPYTSEGTMRGTKDDLHDILLEGKLKPYLRLMVRNPHHAELRRLGGFEGSAFEKAENDRLESIAEEHENIVGDLKKLKLDSKLGEAGPAATTEMVAFLAAGMLRRPVELVPVQGKADQGDPPLSGRISITKGYDAADLTVPLHSHQEAHDRPILVGVGPDGYYALTQRGANGAFTATHRIEADGKGHSLGNLLHAIARGEFKDNTSLGSATGLGGPKYESGKGVLQPNRTARNSVDKLWRKTIDLVDTDLPLVHKGLVKERVRIEPDAGLAELVKDAPKWIMPPGVPAPKDDVKALDDSAGGKSVLPPEFSKKADRPTQAPDFRRQYLAAFNSNYDAASKWLRDLGLPPAPNSGGNANNCLIMTMLQHVLGDYTQDHAGKAAAVRKALVAKFPDIERGAPLHSDTKAAEWLLNHVSATYGGGKPIALMFIEGTPRGEGGELEPVIRVLGDPDADGVQLYGALNYGTHFGALEDTHEQPLLRDFYDVISTHQQSS